MQLNIGLPMPIHLKSHFHPSNLVVCNVHVLDSFKGAHSTYRTFYQIFFHSLSLSLSVSIPFVLYRNSDLKWLCLSASVFELHVSVVPSLSFHCRQRYGTRPNYCCTCSTKQIVRQLYSADAHIYAFNTLYYHANARIHLLSTRHGVTLCIQAIRAPLSRIIVRKFLSDYIFFLVSLSLSCQLFCF